MKCNIVNIPSDNHKLPCHIFQSLYYFQDSYGSHLSFLNPGSHINVTGGVYLGEVLFLTSAPSWSSGHVLRLLAIANNFIWYSRSEQSLVTSPKRPTGFPSEPSSDRTSRQALSPLRILPTTRVKTLRPSLTRADYRRDQDFNATSLHIAGAWCKYFSIHCSRVLVHSPKMPLDNIF